MKKENVSFLKIVACAILISTIVACDDETAGVTSVDRSVIETVASADELPECSAKKEGEQAFVKEDASMRVCFDGDWVSSSGRVDTVYVKGGKDTVFSRDTVFSKDTVVVRDSVFLQGGTDTVYVVSVDTSIQDTGKEYFYNGFFLKGSSVYLHELSDGRNLNQTENIFYEKITRDDGFYKFTARDLVSQYALLQFEGFFYNVVTGKISNSPISLNLLTDMTLRKMAAANVLTNLEYDRVFYLVRKNDMKVWAAKRQAQADILNNFYVDTTGLKDFSTAEDLIMFDGDETDKILLAFTVLLLGDRAEAEFMELLTEISVDIAEDGIWDDSKRKREIAEWAKEADLTGRLDDIRERIAKNKDVEVSDFVKYIRNFYEAELAE